MKKLKKISDTVNSQTKHNWTFLSNHSHVLICLYRDPETRLRDIAISVGITERAIAKIVEDLEIAGFLEKTKEGRRNKYKVHKNVYLRHQLESHKTVGELLDLLK
ncbi:MAG: MarR family transcriptional regulator [Leptospiraceae bacterium]|nr:MarR family transcriptional regulator [Leptospiraceae bacterium]MCP5513130.1 MarR family transcriptional regulator [Leptospiraceae bacterium]